MITEYEYKLDPDNIEVSASGVLSRWLFISVEDSFVSILP